MFLAQGNVEISTKKVVRYATTDCTLTSLKTNVVAQA